MGQKRLSVVSSHSGQLKRKEFDKKTSTSMWSAKYQWKEVETCRERTHVSVGVEFRGSVRNVHECNP